MSGKYILQYGNLAGWPYKIARRLRERGINSINATALVGDVFDLDRKLPYDDAVYSVNEQELIIYLKQIIFLGKMLLKCSLVHYHGSRILNFEHHLFEGRILKAMNIPMIISFGGGDARIVSMARARNPYFYRMPDEERDTRIRKWLSSISKYIRFAATDCEMKEYIEPYFEKVFIFRQPVSLEEMKCRFPDENNGCPVVMHIPTERWAKGTEYIESAIERLKAEGLSFEFRMIRQLTQKQVYEQMAECDIYVDELRCGSHGVTAVEAMASGKPTITYVRKDLIDKYPPDIPIVNANPDTIYSVLKKLILDAGLRHEIGKQSRAYVEKYHAIDVVVSDLLQIYREIGYQG